MAIKGKNMVDLKQSNRAAILMLLHEQGGMSRKQLATKLSLTPAAITMIVAELIEDGLIREVRVLDNNKSAGRKEIMVDIGGAHLFAIGVSFGIENAIISATDIKGNLLSNETFLFDYESGAEYIINKACSFVKKAITQREQQGKTCIGIGVSVRGIINEPMGICENSHGAWPDLDVPVRNMVQAALPGYEVIMRQNVRAQAETYIFDHDEVIESMLLVKNDTGIGSAIIIDNKIYAGFRSHSAEMGHITIDKNGKVCKCGGRGCLESFASCRALIANVTEIYGDQTTPALYALTGGKAVNITFEHITEAIAQGDMQVKNIVDTGIYHFGRVLRGHLGVLDVQKLVLHGSIFHNTYFYNRLKEEINFDNRYPMLDELLVTTDDVNNINIKCSPVLVIKSFYSKGGRMERKHE